VKPFTTWSPQGGTNPLYRDPTSSGLYSTNLIRSMVGYKGMGMIPMFTNDRQSNYNSLQVQLNRRAGKNITWSANYTWSKTLIYERQQFTDDALTRYETGNRPHAKVQFWLTTSRVTCDRRLLKQIRRAGASWARADLLRRGDGPDLRLPVNPVGYPNVHPRARLFRCQMVTAIRSPLVA